MKKPQEDGVTAATDESTCSESRRDFLTKSGMLLGAATFGNAFASLRALASPTTGPVDYDNDRPLYAYVGSRTTRQRKAQGKGIEVYRFSPETGDFAHVQQVSGLVNPSYLAVDSSQRYLYAVHGDTSKVSAFSVDAGTGKLTFINDQYCGGSNPVHLTLDARNQFLAIANYSTGSVSLHPINGDGSLGTLVDWVELEGELGPHRGEQTGPKPHQVQYDPSMKWLVVPAKGLDKVFTLRLDRADTKLVTVSEVACRPGAGPRHAAFHPSQPFCFVVNELDNSVTVYDFDVDTGGLTAKQIIPTLPQTFIGDNTAAAIFTSKDGRFLYASNRGHDSIVVYRIDQTDGLLTSIGWTSTQGRQPRFFTLDPTGNWLLAANEKSHTIVPFGVTNASGELSASGEMLETGSPVCIAFSAP